MSKIKLAVYGNVYIANLLSQIDKYLISNIDSLSEINISDMQYDLHIIDEKNLDSYKYNEIIQKKIIAIIDNININYLNYIVRPFKLINLVSLIDELLSNKEYYINEKFSFNLLHNIIIRKNGNINEEIILTNKESLLFEFLVKNSQIISRDELLKDLWNHKNTDDTHTLETHIYRIRQKLGNDNDLIITTSKGYKLNI